ncbi:MAG: cupin-like domain-containing protein [Gammaproteobacteria bacterium]|nr:cupin-like domain-containing protein [Gammaproteobacteria bacterium]
MSHQHVINEISLPVAEAGDITVAELNDELLSSETPLVIRGLTADWPAVKQALVSTDHVIDYLQGFDTNNAVTALHAPPEAGGRIFYSEDMTAFNFEYRRMALKEAIRQIQLNVDLPSPPSLYVGSTNVDHWLPGFREHNDLPVQHLAPLVSIWIGNQSRVSAHYDFPSNIACVVAGHRRVILFPPEQLPNLYVGPLDFTPAGQPISMVDFHAPDYERFPRFRDAVESAQMTLLEPGDAIVVPSMWWHHLEALDSFNVLVNYWWRNSPSFLGPPLSALQHAILGLRDLPETQRKQWRDLFDFYVFKADPENFEHIPETARGVLNPINDQTAAQIRKMLRDKLL